MDMAGNFTIAQELAIADAPTIGRVVEIAGGGVRLTLDARALRQLAADADPVVAAAGQVGEHIRISAGPLWLVAVVRSLRLEAAVPGQLGSLDDVSHVVTAYVLTATESTPLWGKLGDRHGRRTLLGAALALFLLASAVCGAAQSLGQLIAARAVLV